MSTVRKRSIDEMPWRRTAGAVLAALALAAIAVVAGRDSSDARAAGKQRPANIIVLFTDDQEPSSLKVMKTVRKEMRKKGTTLDRYYHNFPLCCPSRATMLTGQYAHNHGVLSNQYPSGGFGRFDELHAGNAVNDWLDAAGYETGYIGKSFNGYAEPDEYGNLPTYVPPGWDDWRALAPGKAEYFDYTLNQNGNLVDFGEEDDQYSTDQFTKRAKKFIRRSAPGNDPFFLMLGYAAPHGGGGGSPGRSCNRGARPAPRHLGALEKKDYGFPPSFNEDTSDKPTPIRELDPLSPRQIRDIKRRRLCAWESLLAVDESVGSILDAVKRSGERRDTYVIFTSDNGFLRGDHRVKNNKRLLYEPSARAPFIIRGPGVARGERSEDVTVNADLVATMLDISGASPGEIQDGESLLPTLANPQREQGRAILLEAYAGDPTITGVRTHRYLYTEWDYQEPGRLTERELYDTYSDPYQLNNLAGNPKYAPVVANLAGQLAAMIDCAGADCRQHPTAQLGVSGGATGAKGCLAEPVVARLTSSQAGSIDSVEFLVGKRSFATDAAPPYEAAVPYKLLRGRLPKAAEVIGRALYDDGRRVAATESVRACR